MGKRKVSSSKPLESAKEASISAKETAFDPALSSLFASSQGPVKVPQKPVIAAVAQSKVQEKPKLPTPDDTTDEPSLDSDDEEVPEGETKVANDRPRKRRRLDDDNLEDLYFQKLAEEEERDLQQQHELDDQASEVSDSPSNDLQDLSDDEIEDNSALLPVHESLSGSADADLADKTNRTVFLSNVSTTAIKSKTAKKILLTHLESALPETTPPAKIESLRFRSTAYARDAGPKKAAYATKALMDTTAASTHAYVVLSTPAAAKALVTLNGTLILDRHLHIDHLGSPSPTLHRRCIFVGNLPFVDEETIEPRPDQDNPRQRPKAIRRADAEEGLWQVFTSKVGPVDNVRMVRDKHTRIGKGFAYVQFRDENAVEAALLLDGKKFPPLLPRTLRIMRAKKPSEKPRQLDQKRKGKANGKGKDADNTRGRTIHKSRTRESNKRNTPLGLTGLADVAGAAAAARNGRDQRSGNNNKIIFEGHRATAPTPGSAKDRRKEDGKKGSKGNKKRPTNRSAKRGAAFKAGHGKKKRDG